MKDIVCYVKLPSHIRQWAVQIFGNPLRFPAHSYENAVLTRVLQVRPKNVPVHLQQVGEIAVVIPDNRYRDPQYYNYLGKRGHWELVCVITELFSMNLWSDLFCYVHNVRGINAIINDWCRDHGIDVIYREAVRQKFYRMRKNRETMGINLGKSYQQRQQNGAALTNKRYKAEVSLYDVMINNDASFPQSHENDDSDEK